MIEVTIRITRPTSSLRSQESAIEISRVVHSTSPAALASAVFMAEKQAQGALGQDPE